jgi:anti-anti-sigma regulatory factor
MRKKASSKPDTRPPTEPECLSLKVESDENGNIRLKGDVTIHESNYLYTTLRGLVEESREQWTLDLGGLSRIDIAGVQVLTSFKKTVPKVVVHSCPVDIRLYLEQVGLATYLL